MTQHEYIFIAVSIILGLAITRLLHTMAMVTRAHKRVIFHWSSALWAFSILLYILQLWWVGWGLRNIEEWTFLDFLVLVFGSASLYGAAEMALTAPEEDVLDMLKFPGFWKVAARFFGNGVRETWNSFWKPAYLRLVQKYCPSIELGDLHPYPAGVRAQAILRDGTLLHDFLFVGTKRSLHVCNAPSPAATSAFPIAKHICDKVEETQNHG